MGAVLYTIHYGRKGQGARALTTGELSARLLYREGSRIIRERGKRLQEQYNQEILRFRDYGNRACFETVAEGVPAFFRHYDPVFQPQEHFLTLDYPIPLALEKYQGLERMEGYLGYIWEEQKQLRAYPEEEVRYALKQAEPHYEELFVNLWETLQRHVADSGEGK